MNYLSNYKLSDQYFNGIVYGLLIVAFCLLILEFPTFCTYVSICAVSIGTVGIILATRYYNNKVISGDYDELDYHSIPDITDHNCSNLAQEDKCIICRDDPGRCVGNIEGKMSSKMSSKMSGEFSGGKDVTIVAPVTFTRDERFKIIFGDPSIKHGGIGLSKIRIPKNVMAQIMLAVKSAVHVSAGTAATIASVGMGGDTIVDVLFIVMSAAEMMATITQFIYGLGTAAVTVGGKSTNLIAEISRLGFSRGPLGVSTEVRALLAQVPNLAQICGYLTSAFDQIISIAMTVLSAFIPDDAGIIAVAGSYGGKLATAAVGSPIWYAAIIGIFELIPASLRKYVTQPEELRKLFLRIIEFVQNTVLSANKTMLEKMSMFAAGATASGLAASSVLVGFMAPPVAAAGLTTSLAIQTANVALATDSGRKYLREVLDDLKPNLDVAVNVVFTSLPLLFGCAVILQECAS